MKYGWTCCLKYLLKIDSYTRKNYKQSKFYDSGGPIEINHTLGT